MTHVKARIARFHRSAAGERGAAAATRSARPGSRRLDLGAAPALALLAAAGLVMIAYGNNAARESAAEAQPLFWAGLALIYAPIALRLLSVSAARAERIALVVTLGLALFGVKILASPTGFVNFDELGSWRATHDVIQSGRFLADNPLVVSTEGFPGLEAVTAAVAELAHLSIFHAGLVVIGVARAMLMLALFLFLERVTRSARAAGAGVAIYACNPSFLYFDSQFGYESLALLIGAALLLMAARWADPRHPHRSPERGLIVAMAIVVCTLTITHHMTSFALLAFLALWAGLIALARPAATAEAAEVAAATASGDGDPAARPSSFLDGPALPALLLAGTVSVWFAFAAGAVTIDELGGVISGTVDSTVRLITGGTGPKTFFQGGGESNSLALRGLAFASVIPVLVLLPFGLRRGWHGPDSRLRRALALVALLYPVTLGLRLTLAGSETSQRASEFVFVGVAFLAAMVTNDLAWPKRRLRRGVTSVALAAVATVVFLGGVVIGVLPATRQPGPFLVGADARSITPQGLSAAEFAATHLPSESRVIVDRSNAMVLASYGDLNPVFGQIHGIPVPRVLFSESFDRADRLIIRDQFIDYIVVDRRLSQDLPVLGYYMENDEPGAYTRDEPISLSSLTKFAGASGLDPVFDSGPITIYDTSGLRSR